MLKKYVKKKVSKAFLKTLTVNTKQVNTKGQIFKNVRTNLTKHTE